ncbi:hypothetical protein H6P81_005225 [Aristolochia fimbriata]|uniref:YqgF/RNase H-like domain-containing protein n=1 Tax=Aristolochia fimbriata TaxID=158543 RepID=A0AAV7EWQ6_ARIFI|nr:hypothetical protein H6P81_005225 [Aristolochia fimbriata]
MALPFPPGGRPPLLELRLPYRVNGTRTRVMASLEAEIPPNAFRRKEDPSWRAGFSLGIDLGGTRTGLAISKGFSPRPLSVLELRGEKLELRLLEIAAKEEVDEFIVGLPISRDGKETPQSNKVRSIAGRLAVRAAERGWRVYLQDEHGTSADALYYMIDMGLKRSARQQKLDAYSAMMVLERYFTTSGSEAELVFPKDSALQEKLRRRSCED